MLVDCGEGGVDFASKFNKTSIFDSSMYFDFIEGQKEENYMKIVKDSENHGIAGINPGYYTASPNFSMTFSTNAETQVEVDNWVASLPQSLKMRKIIIQ